MEQSNNTGQVIGALLIGAAIGSILGILFAPDKGSETRKNISLKGGELSDNIKHKFSDLVDEIKKEANKVKDKASEYMENGSVYKEYTKEV